MANLRREDEKILRLSIYPSILYSLEGHVGRWRSEGVVYDRVVGVVETYLHDSISRVTSSSGRLSMSVKFPHMCHDIHGFICCRVPPSAAAAAAKAICSGMEPNGRMANSRFSLPRLHQSGFNHSTTPQQQISQGNLCPTPLRCSKRRICQFAMDSVECTKVDPSAATALDRRDSTFPCDITSTLPKP